MSAPESGHLQCTSPCQLCAKSGHRRVGFHQKKDIAPGFSNYDLFAEPLSRKAPSQIEANFENVFALLDIGAGVHFPPTLG
jgi:hypothetical protein